MTAQFEITQHTIPVNMISHCIVDNDGRWHRFTRSLASESAITAAYLATLNASEIDGFIGRCGDHLERIERGIARNRLGLYNNMRRYMQVHDEAALINIGMYRAYVSEYQEQQRRVGRDREMALAVYHEVK